MCVWIAIHTDHILSKTMYRPMVGGRASAKSAAKSPITAPAMGQSWTIYPRQRLGIFFHPDFLADRSARLPSALESHQICRGPQTSLARGLSLRSGQDRKASPPVGSFTPPRRQPYGSLAGPSGDSIPQVCGFVKRKMGGSSRLPALSNETSLISPAAIVILFPQ